MADLSGDEYERLTEHIVSCISSNATVKTVRLERNVVLQGKASRNQIDVLWVFEAGGSTHTVMFECRSYARRLTQQAVHAWRGVVEDLASLIGSCEGVMVTQTGYQSGAQAVAETYGVLILELRRPTDADVSNRVLQINLSVTARMPVIEDLRVEAEQIYETLEAAVPLAELRIDLGSGNHQLVSELLLAGELGSMSDPPTQVHPVVREFTPAASLYLEGRVVATVRVLRASVGEDQGDSTVVVIGGRERLSWLLKDTLGGTRVWFTSDGKHYTTLD